MNKKFDSQIIFENRLGGYGKNKLNEIKSRGDIIATSKEELKKYVYEAFENKNSKKNIHLGMIPKDTIDKIKKEVIGIKNKEIDTLFKENKEYDLAINQDTIRHIKKVSMIIEDVLDIVSKIDEIVVDFDEVQKTVYEKGKQKNDALRFEKEFFDGKYYAVELLYKQKRVLSTQTIFMDKMIILKKRNLLNYCL